MNVFNIIGPIMIGPSSSHTAGAVRLGRVVNKVAGSDDFKELDIELSGSFARTYRGHGTDRALLAGIMGYHSYSEEIRDALQIAKDRGIDYRFIENDIPGVDFTGESNTILVLHRDKPGMIALVTQIMYDKYKDLNIGNFRLSRPEKGGIALMTIEIDQMPPEELMDEINKLPNVENALLIRAI